MLGKLFPGNDPAGGFANWEGTAMKATQELFEEHGAVVDALKLLDKVTAAIDEKAERAPEDLERLLDFFRGFVDGCHHGKEEDVLIPALERRGAAGENIPLDRVLAEHELGREHIRGMADGLERLRDGDSGAAATIREHAHAYHELLMSHIDKEDKLLFPLADRLLADDAVALNAQYAEIERERVGAGKHEAYHTMLHELRDRYDV
jgi:hemerythrin-like domain-containing protein